MKKTATALQLILPNIQIQNLTKLGLKNYGRTANYGLVEKPRASMRKKTAQAQIAIVVCGNKDRFLEGEDNVLWEQDLSASSENILLAAHAIGLGMKNRKC